MKKSFICYARASGEEFDFPQLRQMATPFN